MSPLLSKILWAITSPSTILLVTLIAGLVLLWGQHVRTGRLFVTAGILLLLVVTVLPVHSWFLAPLEERFPRPAQSSSVDGIIVLGGAIEADLTERHGIPSLNDAAERITTFVELARRYPSAKLVFTGGTSRPIAGGIGEADATKQILESMGVDSNRVIFEKESRNTYENAIYSKKLINPRPGELWLLVTSASHVARSVGVFRNIGWDVTGFPVAYKSEGHYAVNLADHWKYFGWAMHEWIALLTYRLIGYTNTFFPSP